MQMVWTFQVAKDGLCITQFLVFIRMSYHFFFVGAESLCADVINNFNPSFFSAAPKSISLSFL